MKKYTKKTTLEYFKNIDIFNNITLQLDKKHMLILSKGKEKAKYMITLLDANKQKVKMYFWDNYTEKCEEVYKEMKKLKLLPHIEEGISIFTENLGQGAVQLDLFDMSDTSNTTDTFNKLDSNILKQHLSDFLYKIKIRNNKMVLISINDETTVRYTKNDMVKILVEYVKLLVESKKNSKITNINHQIKLVGDNNQAQGLNIVESDNDGVTLTKDKGFTDKQLMNSSFALCSLNELAVNDTKLRIWINKIITKEALILITLDRI